ncbi:MAG TPA: hypothetical protein VGC77_05255 [Rhodopseudomonas sp.]|uniref:hypothetical protein n=1 Tax=Rhodopseudomonas sp. TaxID=1078 RepID=UPI002ED8A4A8
MSLQVAILKVLSSYPNGCATVDRLKADLAILGASGRDWTDRMKQMLARAPQLDIFGQRLVLRDAQGWQLTAAGRQMLATIETPRIEAPPLLEAVATQAAEPCETAARPAAAPCHPTREPKREGRPQRNFVIIEGGKSQPAAPEASAA